MMSIVHRVDMRVCAHRRGKAGRSAGEANTAQPPHTLAHTQDERAGVGVVLGVRSDGALYIHKICDGGAAEGQGIVNGDGQQTCLARFASCGYSLPPGLHSLCAGC